MLYAASYILALRQVSVRVSTTKPSLASHHFISNQQGRLEVDCSAQRCSCEEGTPSVGNYIKRCSTTELLQAPKTIS